VPQTAEEVKTLMERLAAIHLIQSKVWVGVLCACVDYLFTYLLNNHTFFLFPELY